MTKNEKRLLAKVAVFERCLEDMLESLKHTARSPVYMSDGYTPMIDYINDALYPELAKIERLYPASGTDGTLGGSCASDPFFDGE